MAVRCLRVGPEAAAEAARFDGLAKSVSDRELARYYEDRATEARKASEA